MPDERGSPFVIPASESRDVLSRVKLINGRKNLRPPQAQSCVYKHVKKMAMERVSDSDSF